MTSLRFVGLPELTYTGLSAPSGLQIESMPNVQRLRLETSPKLDAIQMLRDVLASQTASRKLSMLRISNMTLAPSFLPFSNMELPEWMRTATDRINR